MGTWIYSFLLIGWSSKVQKCSRNDFCWRAHWTCTPCLYLMFSSLFSYLLLLLCTVLVYAWGNARHAGTYMELSEVKRSLSELLTFKNIPKYPISQVHFYPPQKSLYIVKWMRHLFFLFTHVKQVATLKFKFSVENKQTVLF